MKRAVITVKRNGRRRGIACGGFTLVEVLAALVLVGIVLPVAMRSATLSQQVAARARHQQEATLLAEARVNELMATGDSSQLTGSGVCDAPWSNYSWQVESVARENGCYEFTVTVSWTEQSALRSVSLSSIMYPQQQQQQMF